ncbi:alpha/beta hydrolase-fold protein [Corynebacterium guangdongense]|uniref:S-formylglutathione hydrolase FrmB n=1 Tax=Corynebacterium guangdongense TaxID=1783348 RepID=A0ABU2A0C8_9CORY|nr:alpha/beta hydrolase-fold protein [Corynebacterium guangdongense]MDR7330455.1 S-formylglutathione hydrolase FrmB [Corynebacterium guangdongense]WJZ19013.1 Diacylglycerol acyltransferase/mycolyltransferase Ag85A precursor [Corynebacterium guangdongense]
MRDTASSSRSPKNVPNLRRRGAALIALPAALLMGVTTVPAVSAQSSLGSSFSDGFAPGEPPVRTPVNTTYPDVQGLPAGVSVERVDWLESRHVRVYIESAAMPDKLQKVDILLARDWHANPEKTYPEVWALDGLRARDDESGWTIETNIKQQYADRNVNVILPIGGQSSFYSDWQQPDQGTHYMWETFLTQELVPILDNEFRSNGRRAVVGLSMGGTAAMNLAQRHPYLFDFVGSFSGYLDTTTTGMPEAIAAAQMDAGGFTSTKMWGPAYSQDWIDHDPKLGIEALKDTSVYVSSGSGQDDYGLEDSVAEHPSNLAGVGLEIIARMSTQTFVDYAKRADVPVTARFRPSGTHNWAYWQFELNEAWPQMANALQISAEDRGADCVVGGAIAQATMSGIIGSCVNNEYPVGEEGEGRAQDFRNGTAFWSPDTGAHALYGRILAKYSQLGGATSWLGFPVTGERVTPDGRGRYVHFENGSIYWTAANGAYAIPKDMFTYWGTQGWENSKIGFPVAEGVEIDGGLVQKFENGWLTRSADGKNAVVHGAIGAKYGEIGTADSDLGYPTSDEIPLQGGAFQRFENGNIYWSPATGAHVVLYGAIFDHWGAANWERGEFGYPTTDTTRIPAGGLTQDFQGGTIRELSGVVTDSRN